MSGDGTRVFVLDGEDLVRGRIMVPLRYIVALPHYIWLGIFRLFVLIALPLNWLLTVILGRQPTMLYEFLSGYIRYRSDVLSYLTLLADPYPGFAAVRSYPVETWVPSSQPASRLSYLFRPILALPAVIVVHLAEFVLIALTIVGFFASIILGRMPFGLQRLGLMILRLIGETSGYTFLIQRKYPSIAPRSGERF